MDEYKSKLIDIHKRLFRAGEHESARDILFFMRDKTEFEVLFKESYKNIFDYIKDDWRFYLFIK